MVSFPAVCFMNAAISIYLDALHVTHAKMRFSSAAGLLCLASRVRAWNHVSEDVLQDRLESAGYTLVACEFSFFAFM